MATYSHVCDRCGFDAHAGAIVAECPHCGGELRLTDVRGMILPRAPVRDNPEAIDDVMRGFEDLLGRS